MNGLVPNQFPAMETGLLKLALIGEAPGSNEVVARKPFVGAAGQLLDRQLGKVGLLRARCFVGNVCQTQPPRNEFDAFDWAGEEVQTGIAALLADLRTFKPNLVVTLGNVPLHLFLVGNAEPERRKRGAKFVHNWPRKVTQWRGSLFMSSELTTANLWLSDDVETAKAFDLNQGRTCQSVVCNSDVVVNDREQREQPDQVEKLNRQDQDGERPSLFQPAKDGCQPSPLRWKCLATLHPAFCLRSWGENFNLQSDLRRAREEAATPVLNLPEMDFDYGPA